MGQIPSVIKVDFIESMRDTMTTNPTIPISKTQKQQQQQKNRDKKSTHSNRNTNTLNS
tara:strand:+ start:2234 stop:2407 length:174 start_codon:yes stop_codon:yes gene_type:complete